MNSQEKDLFDQDKACKCHLLMEGILKIGWRVGHLFSFSLGNELETNRNRKKQHCHTARNIAHGFDENSLDLLYRDGISENDISEKPIYPDGTEVVWRQIAKIPSR